MSRIYTRDLVPGMITDEDVYSVNDQLIISKGQKLADKYINRLVFYSCEPGVQGIQGEL